MACNDETKTINGREYYVVQMPPTKAIPVKLKLMKVLGNPLTVLASASKADGGSVAALGDAIGALFEGSSEEEVFALIKRVVETAKVDGQRINIDNHFSGDHMPDLYKVFFWVLEVNFSSFFGGSGFGGIGAKIQEALSTTKSAPEKQPQT